MTLRIIQKFRENKEAEAEAAKASGLIPETDIIEIKTHKQKKQKGKRDIDLSKFSVVLIV